MEAIFVDDGSTDETLSAIRSAVKNADMKIEIFSRQWEGLGSSRNFVVENAEGDYIVWVDGDMILPRNHVRKQVVFMEENPRIGIAGGERGILSGENLVATLENISFMVYSSNNQTGRAYLPGTGGSIYRVEAIRQIGGFDSHIRGVGEDQEAASRIMSADWLVGRSQAIFFERGRQSWQELWKQYFWHGYGLYSVYRTNRKIFSIARMSPIASFLAGAMHIFDAYRITRKKSVLLLPFHFTFKMVAWCVGFAKAKARVSL